MKNFSKVSSLVIAGLFFFLSFLNAHADQVTAGSTVMLSVTADGTAPFTYQWKKDGVNVVGATGSTLTIASIQSADAGSYSVVVANSAGSTSSDVSVLTVVPFNVAPAITTQPVSQSVMLGGNVIFTVAASGTPTPTFQWQKGGINIPSATGAALTLSGVQASAAGNYTVTATNSAGSTTSVNAVLSVVATTAAPTITTQPVSQSATVGTNVTFLAAASGTPTPTFQWQKGGINIIGATGATLTLSNVQTTAAGTYTVVVTNSVSSATSVNAVLSIVATTAAPTFTTQPLSQSATVGTNVTFLVTASGTPTPTFQWRKDGINIVGATGTVLTLTGVQTTAAGTYTVVATNSVSSNVSAGAVLTIGPVITTTAVPVITKQPLTQSATVGANVTFTVAASGLPSPTFQWKKNGVAIAGANSATLVLSNVAASATGTYTVVATNTAGSATSPGAILTLNASTYPAGFDAVGYLARYPDLAAAFGTDLNAAWQHYLNYGINEGRVFDDSFRVDEYIWLYGDLQAAFANNRQGALLHWLTYGRAEGRMGRVPPTFDLARYLANNPDLQAAFGSLSGGRQKATVWNHYLNYGVNEGRTDGDFDVRAYLAQYGDLRAAFGNNLEAAALHWYLYGRYEGRRIPAGFDVQGYLTRNPDVAAAYGRDLYGAWLHYWDYGINEGRVFDDLFRVDEYLALYADLRAVFGTDRQAALLHWLRYGRAEGRQGRF